MAPKKAPTAESLWRDYLASVKEANALAAKRIKIASERYTRGMDKIDKPVKRKPEGKANVSRPQPKRHGAG